MNPNFTSSPAYQQGYNLPNLPGTLYRTATQMNMQSSQYTGRIASTETNTLYLGSVVTLSENNGGVLDFVRASATTPLTNDVFIISPLTPNIRQAGFSSQITDPLDAYRGQSITTIKLTQGVEIMMRVTGVIALNDELMVDNTIASRDVLIKYVNDGTNVPVAKALQSYNGSDANNIIVVVARVGKY